MYKMITTANIMWAGGLGGWARHITALSIHDNNSDKGFGVYESREMWDLLPQYI